MQRQAKRRVNPESLDSSEDSPEESRLSPSLEPLLLQRGRASSLLFFLLPRSESRVILLRPPLTTMQAATSTVLVYLARRILLSPFAGRRCRQPPRRSLVLVVVVVVRRRRRRRRRRHRRRCRYAYPSLLAPFYTLTHCYSPSYTLRGLFLLVLFISSTLSSLVLLQSPLFLRFTRCRAPFLVHRQRCSYSLLTFFLTHSYHLLLLPSHFPFPLSFFSTLSYTLLVPPSWRFFLRFLAGLFALSPCIFSSPYLSPLFLRFFVAVVLLLFFGASSSSRFVPT